MALKTAVFLFFSILKAENPYFCNPFWGLSRVSIKGNVIILLSSVG
jgi:hypothetical protein